MKYEKPQITLVASAIETIKGSQLKDDSIPFDGNGYVTVNAYEADELGQARIIKNTWERRGAPIQISRRSTRIRRIFTHPMRINVSLLDNGQTN